MRGLIAFTSAAPRPSLSSAPGRYASRNTSDVAASRRSASIAGGCLRSSTRLRLLRLSATKLTLSPARIGGVARPMSPCGGSTLITSAPMSARSVPASGPAMKLASSMTRIPASGFGMRFLLNLQPGLVDDLLVHRHLAGDAGAEDVGSLGDDRQAGLGESLPHVGPGQDGGELLRQPVDDRLRRSGRRIDALEGVGDRILDPDLVERGNVGKVRPAPLRGYRDRAQLAGLDHAHQRSDVRGVEVDLAGERGGGRRAGAGERNVLHVDAGAQLDELAGEIGRGAGPGARPIELARIGLCLP